MGEDSQKPAHILDWSEAHLDEWRSSGTAGKMRTGPGERATSGPAAASYGERAAPATATNKRPIRTHRAHETLQLEQVKARLFSFI